MRVGEVLLIVVLLALLWMNLGPVAIDDGDKVVGRADFVESDVGLGEEEDSSAVLPDPDDNYHTQESIDQESDLKKTEGSSMVSEAEGVESLPVPEIPKEKIPTPDELFESQQQINVNNELPATIPDMMVIPPELEELELVGWLALNSKESLYEEALPDDPDQPYASVVAELPASENFEPAIPFELEQLEKQYEYLEASGQLIEPEVNVPLPDNPDTGEIDSQTGSDIEMSVESERDADLE